MSVSSEFRMDPKYFLEVFSKIFQLGTFSLAVTHDNTLNHIDLVKEQRTKTLSMDSSKCKLASDQYCPVSLCGSSAERVTFTAGHTECP